VEDSGCHKETRLECAHARYPWDFFQCPQYTFVPDVSRQCLLVLVIKIVWTEGKALGSEEGKAMEIGWFYDYGAQEGSRRGSLLYEAGLPSPAYPKRVQFPSSRLV
jgi:hypothetical protein